MALPLVMSMVTRSCTYGPEGAGNPGGPRLPGPGIRRPALSSARAWSRCCPQPGRDVQVERGGYGPVVGAVVCVGDHLVPGDRAGGKTAVEPVAAVGQPVGLGVADGRGQVAQVSGDVSEPCAFQCLRGGAVELAALVL